MPNEPKTFVSVDKDVLDALLKMARIGERQLVTFDFDTTAMAQSAAVVSKDMCNRSKEILLAILSDESPDLESMTEGLED